jgi:2-keto-4-pentenoate hydratase/2-oxohepta-3-ene-1,7-dioic acid hydratase in catechol pathway
MSESLMANDQVNSAYQHQWLGGELVSLPVGKVVCVGRNYAEHAKELNNPIPTEPLLFMKPASSLVAFDGDLSLPTRLGEIHYESEIAVLIGERLSSDNVSSEAIARSIVGVAAALDLTLRDVQSTLKEKGQPWEKAKAFDGACPISAFVPISEVSDLTDLDIALDIDDRRVQQGNAKEMLTPIAELLRYIVQYFTLMPGDVVLTGTPKGVGALSGNQALTLHLANRFSFSARTSE